MGSRLFKEVGLGVDDKKNLVNINDNLNNNKLDYLFEMHKRNEDAKVGFCKITAQLNSTYSLRSKLVYKVADKMNLCISSGFIKNKAKIYCYETGWINQKEHFKFIIDYVCSERELKSIKTD